MALPRVLPWLLGAVLPAVLLAILLAEPRADESWESHPAHFWLVLAAALTSIVLGYAVHVAARRRRDARLLLISLAFVASAGFLRLHALATPGVPTDLMWPLTDHNRHTRSVPGILACLVTLGCARGRTEVAS